LIVHGGCDSIASASRIREAGGFRPSLFRKEIGMVVSVGEEKWLDADVVKVEVGAGVEAAGGDVLSP
jgi:hypothetical protein